MSISLDDLDQLLEYPHTGAIHAAARAVMNPNPTPIPTPETGMVPRPFAARGTETSAIPNVNIPTATAPNLPFPPSGIPDISRPTGAESRAAGKEEFQRGIPSVTAEPLTKDYFQQEREKSDYLRAHPWGSDVSAHPGVGGKIAHVLGRIGNVAGDIVAPETMALIRGTDLHNELERGAQMRGFNQAVENDQKEALAGEEQANAWRAMHPEEKELSGDWRPIGESGWEVSGRTGETQQIPRFQAPTKTPPPEEATLRDLMTGNNGQPRVNPDTGQPYTEFEAYRAVKGAGQRQTHTSPFEAYAYGSPEEKKAAQDFLALEKRLGRANDKPGEIEQRYSLYKRDPDAYKEMFGDRGAAQESRDQAQAARMLNYFDKQRKAVQEDFTLDDAEKQRQLSEIDELEKPYLATARPRNTRETNANAVGGTAHEYKAGDEVTYKGQRMKVSRVRPDGKLELQAIGAGRE